MPRWTLGQTSSRYETGGRGPGTVSTGVGDYGGVSYGSYQLSTSEGTVREFLRYNPTVAAHFAHLTPGTDAFNNRWREVAAADPQGFHNAQHDFIQHKFYDVQMQRLKAEGIDLSQRGAAVQDMLWSTSVQYRGLTKGIVQGALAGKDMVTMSDVDIVSAVQDYKRDHNSTLFASSRALWPGLLARAASEKQDLIELARSYGGDKVPGAPRVELTPDQQQTLQQFKAQVGEPLSARGMNAQQIDQLGLAAVRHLDAMPGKTVVQQFLLSSDGQRIAVKHATGQGTEFGVQDALQAPSQAVPAPTKEAPAPALSR